MTGPTPQPRGRWIELVDRCNEIDDRSNVFAPDESWLLRKRAVRVEVIKELIAFNTNLQ